MRREPANSSLAAGWVGVTIYVLILSDLHGASGTKLLYLTGDKNRDTITRMLSEKNVELELLQVYRTQGSSSFESRLSSVLETASKGA
jgi:uroporphyrinogen-III synthase